MNKHEFLTELDKALSGIPESEKKKTLDYYTEMIADACEEGVTEENIIAGFDSPKDIAQRIIDETPIHKFVTADVKNKNINALTIALLIVGSPIWISLLLALFSIILSVYIALWSIVVSLFTLFAALALSGAVSLLTAPIALFHSPLKAMFLFGSALACIGLSVFMFYISVWFSKAVIRFTVFLIRKTKNLFIKKGSASK